jgi:dienelactone hydrolase
VAAARLGREDVNHAFFNDTGARYYPAAAAAAYERVLDWFERFVDHDRRRGRG